MTAQQALAEALVYLAGVRDTESTHADQDAALLLERLGRSGFALVPIPDLGSGKPTPESLRALREGLRLTAKAVAREAGVSEEAIYNAERPGSRAHRATVEAIATALTRLGAIPRI